MSGKNYSNFYGRKKGRPLNASRAEALETLLPALRVDEALLKEDGTLDPALLFRHPGESRDLVSSSNQVPAPAGMTPHKFVFEIGFGHGERLAEHMAREPETAFLGAEPFINGMSGFLKEISGKKEEGRNSKTTLPSSSFPLPYNIRVIMDDAMILARSLKDGCLDTLYILNPDPWHKTRHHKRRIVNSETLDVFARILKPGGQLIMSTDVPYLAEWMVTHAINHPAFHWSAKSAEDWRTPPENWIHTRYETKRAKGADKMVYLIFEKTPLPWGEG